ncbi:MAG TPA: MBL fold metallo-hydrolase [Nitrososphaeraceae archaeon]|jgi:L-ascorbate metabolism protein UlaG (beta-lactamase superfamily)|nr:MBL fold metallo-hydrolase [Nitrososphaeraceae archaeon]
MEINNIKFHWMGHDGFKIVTDDNKVIYIDPYKLSKAYHKKNDAELVLISHNHFDHLSIEDLRHIINDETTIIAALECSEKLNQEGFKNIKNVEPGQTIQEKNINIEIVPAYNIDKNYHPKDDKKVGFIITCNNMRIYHAGDTDKISEMAKYNPDIALMPVSGVYVMTAEEAADCVNNLLKPTTVAIPMHYGSIVGNLDDAIKFKKLVHVCKVEILSQE